MTFSDNCNIGLMIADTGLSCVVGPLTGLVMSSLREWLISS